MAFGFSKKNSQRIADAVQRVERSSQNKIQRTNTAVGVGRALQFFQTKSGPDGTEYPKHTDKPTVYYAIKIKNVGFTETVGQQSLQFSSIPDSEQHIFSREYLSLGAVVSASNRGGSWFVTQVLTSSVSVEIRVKLNEILVNGGEADATIFEWMNDWVEAENITVTEATGITEDVASGTIGWATYNAESDKYILTRAECDVPL